MSRVRRRWPVAAAVFLLGVLAVRPAAAQHLVYGDALLNGWQDWSWDPITRNLANSSPVQSGTASISVQYTGAWSGLQFGRNDAIDVSAYDTLRLYIHGGSSGGQTVEIAIGNNVSGSSVTRSVTPSANTWTMIDVALTGLGTPRSVNYMHWFNATPNAQPVFYVDNVSLIAAGIPTPTPVPPGVGPALSIDAANGRHAIDPHIYGMNFPSEALAAELAMPVARWGGNATTRYNWQNDTSNRAFDWYFENIPNDNANANLLPDGSSSDLFVEQNLRTGTDTLLTVPLIGWTPKQRLKACGFSVAKYGAQQSTDPWTPDCGNGVRSNGSMITGNDPTDTSSAITPAFVQGWMTHLVGRYGNANAGGVLFYNLDNEPMLWNSTHRDVHPTPLSYDELRDRTVAYAAAVKASDPTALTLGPAEWGWTNYFYSALDAAPGGSWWNNPQDRLAHGNTPLVDWYLQQLRSYEQQNGVRLLDYLDLHYYPQANGVSLSPAGNSDTQALRLRSTRSLWDPTYTDESWIAEAVQLIPRMRQWVNTQYPGTKTAIGEYNWGALDHINGALAQADVLGIFGREGLDLATHWDPPASSQPGAYAFRIYRNYDGNGRQFGEVGVSASSGDQGQLSIYAAQRGADNALTVVLINKTTAPLTSSLSWSGFSASGTVQVYRYSPANLGAIVREADQSATGTNFTSTYPASSISLLVLPAGSQPVQSPTSTRTISPTATRTPTPSLTGTRTPTWSPTRSASMSPTRTPTLSPTRTAVPTNSVTASATATRSATRTASASASPTSTPTATNVVAATATAPAASATMTATAPASPTNTARRTPRSVKGNVYYEASAQPLAGITVRAQADTTLDATADANGQFVVQDMSDGNWTVQPIPMADPAAAITALDATYVLQAVVGSRAVSALQRLACDTNGSGNLTAIDASLILQYRVGLISQLPARQNCGTSWLFAPSISSGGSVTAVWPQLSSGNCTAGSIEYQPLSDSAEAQDFKAASIGDCNLSWQPSSGGGALQNVAARLELVRRSRRSLRYALVVTGANAGEVTLTYNPHQMKFHSLRRSVRNALIAAHETQPGQIKIAVASDTTSAGRVALVDFDRSAAGAQTPHLSAQMWATGSQ